MCVNEWESSGNDVERLLRDDLSNHLMLRGGATWISAVPDLLSLTQQPCNSSQIAKTEDDTVWPQKSKRHGDYQLRVVGFQARSISEDEAPFHWRRGRRDFRSSLRPSSGMQTCPATSVFPVLSTPGSPFMGVTLSPLHFITYIFHLSWDSNRQWRKRRPGVTHIWHQWVCRSVTATW